MKPFLLILLLFITTGGLMSKENRISLAIHGGAGTILKEKMSPELEAQYHQALKESLTAGYAVLQKGGTSVEAVQATIVVMENSPLFNAGKGAVFTHHRTNEMDASIMNGADLNAGAITGVKHVKNPILLAARVMNNSEHVILSGLGAEAFAKTQKMDLVESSYFFTERRWKQLKDILMTDPDATRLSEDKKDNYLSVNDENQNIDDAQTEWPDDKKFGTVGAVALDKFGNLSAGTSTGGMTNKKYGRIGDSPIIGAGTYAENNVCAISATGHGEFFIRAAVSYDICARVKYKNISLQQAADEVIQEKLVDMKGEGGIVGLSGKGDVVFSFNSAGMYRGYVDEKGVIHTEIFEQKK